jgi:ribosome-associated protein
MLSIVENAMTPTTKTSNDVLSSVRAAAQAALDRKAIDLKILHLEPVSDFTDYFVVMSGSNERQVQALADGIVKTLRQRKLRPLHVEGMRNARWVLLDYGDFLVHVFDEERRDFYGLERLWGDAPEVKVELST